MTTDPLVIAAAALIGVVGVARLTRLITSDSWPPAEWFRVAFANWTRHGSWSVLVTCPFCAAPYVAAAALAWALLSDLDGWDGWAWWVFWGWLAGSYAASMIVVRDEPPE